MRSSFGVVVCAVACLSACSGGSSGSPSPTPSSPTAPTAPAPVPPTTPTAPAAPTQCTAYGNRMITVGRTSSDGAFTHAPFNAADLSLITNGQETNDPRFAYNWIRNRGSRINIYAPADGVLVRLRHKTANAQFNSDDFDLFLLVACDPSQPVSRDTLVRFNHITHPRDDIRAAYAAGSLPSQDLTVDPPIEYEDRQVPLSNIAVKAGDLLGSTSGTPTGNNFDFMIAINNATVCPFTPLAEPHRATLLAMLGPQRVSPAGPPQPGYPCTGYGAAP